MSHYLSFIRFLVMKIWEVRHKRRGYPHLNAETIPLTPKTVVKLVSNQQFYRQY